MLSPQPPAIVKFYVYLEHIYLVSLICLPVYFLSSLESNLYNGRDMPVLFTAFHWGHSDFII